MVLITYTPGPATRPEVYEPWLRSVDNPTFNRIPGIGEYSNWKLHSGNAAFTHFDFLGLAAPEDLERVWFSPELDQFRAKWVERWGYSGAVPSRSSAYATLFTGHGEPIRAREKFVRLELNPATGVPGDRWEAVAALRKHWAIGRAASGERWQIPIGELNPLDCGAISLRFEPQPREGGIVAECIAAPG